MQKTAKLFMNGKSQAVRLPQEFRFEGSEVIVRRVGQSVLLTPLDEEKRFEQFLETLERFGLDFMPERNQPAQQERESTSS